MVYIQRQTRDIYPSDLKYSLKPHKHRIMIRKLICIHDNRLHQSQASIEDKIQISPHDKNP